MICVQESMILIPKGRYGNHVSLKLIDQSAYCQSFVCRAEHLASSRRARRSALIVLVLLLLCTVEGGRRERSSIPCATRAWERPRNAGRGVAARFGSRADSAAAPPPLCAGPTTHRLHCPWAPPASLLSSSTEQRPSHCTSFSFPFSSCGGGLGFGEGLGMAESQRRRGPGALPS